uniref:CCHC-type domain-containing protein n=1 Tax=Strigamia maritima TaxID=126957 RepID=T1IL54_STRMM
MAVNLTEVCFHHLYTEIDIAKFFDDFAVETAYYSTELRGEAIQIARESENGPKKIKFNMPKTYKADDKVDKLDRSNWKSWMMDVQLMLEQHGLWGFADGTDTQPETGTPGYANEILKWRERSSAAKAMVCRSVSQPYKPVAIQGKTCKDVLDKLRAVFQPKSRARRAQLRAEFIMIPSENTYLDDKSSSEEEIQDQTADELPKLEEEHFGTPSSSGGASRISKKTPIVPEPKGKEIKTRRIIREPVHTKRGITDIYKRWERKKVERVGGASAGYSDVYYYSPDGTKLKNGPEIPPPTETMRAGSDSEENETPKIAADFTTNVDGEAHYVTKKRIRAYCGKVKEPKTYEEAISSPQKELWLEAINEELGALQDHFRRSSAEKDITKSAASGIAKLDRTNYVQWCIDDRAKSRAIILQSLVPRLQSAAIKCDTTQAVWQHLKRLFESSSIAREASLVETFYGIRRLENEELDTFVSRLEKAEDDLIAANVKLKLEDQIKAYILLSRVGKDFELQIQSIYQWQKDNFTYEKVLEALLLENNRRKLVAVSEVSLEAVQAFSSKSKVSDSKTSANESYLQKISCFKCNQQGHFARDCVQNVSVSQDASYLDSMMCYTCGKTGHMSRQCPDWLRIARWQTI